MMNYTRMLLLGVILQCFSGMYSIAKEFDYSGIMLDHVVIQGSSNITDFMLTYIGDKNQKFDLIADNVNDSVISFKIPIEYITANNRLMVDDFRALIKAEEFPNISISIGKDQIQSILHGQNKNEISVRIALAGRTNVYTIPFYFGSLPGRFNYLMGKANLRLTDYDLDPSKKFFGLIKLNNEVFVNFRIILELA